MTAGSARRLSVVNPLPAALHHYVNELYDVLLAAGAEVDLSPTPDIEVAGSGRGRKARRAIESLLSRLGGTAQPTVVVWPVFGLADPATWLLHRGHIWVVVHDPTPLRHQGGMGSLAATAGRLATGRLSSGHLNSGRGVGVIAHTSLAAQVLLDRGWSPVRVPHPMLRPEPRTSMLGQSLVVLGQWKPARSLEPLERLAELPEWTGRRRIVGRGWPEVAGWSVDSRFVAESDLTDQIDRSACVVLPYDRYFQSNISVRALERLRPVVGRRHEFLLSLFGADWPGIVDDEDWAGAIARVSRVAPSDIEARRSRYWESCVSEWRQFVITAR